MKTTMKDLAKQASIANQTNLLLKADGTVTPLPKASAGCVVGWYDCDPPHSYVTAQLNCGETLFYNAWENGSCNNKSHTCNCAADGTVNLLPDGSSLRIEPSGDGFIVEEADANGNVLSRECKGKCDGKTVGPIACPEGKSPSLDCGSNPPTIKCI